MTGSANSTGGGGRAVRDAWTLRGWLADLQRTLTLALPIMAGLAGQMVMGLTDTVMVGQLGTVPLAAVAYGHNLVHVPWVAAIGLVTAVGVLTSHAYGRQDPAGAGEVLRHGVWLSSLVGLACALGLVFGRYHVSWLRQPPEVVAASHDYILWVAWSLIPGLVSIVLKQFCEALNRPWPTTLILLGGVVFNVGLNWLWIFGHAGFPALGVEGAALATLVSRVTIAVGMAWFVCRDARLRRWGPTRWLAPWSPRSFLAQLRLGSPVALQHLLEVGAFVVGSLMMGWIGAGALAAHQVAMTCAGTTFILALGFGMAVGIRVGHAWGAGEHDRLLWIGCSGLGFTALFMSGFGLMFATLGHWIAAAFTPAGEVVALATVLLLVAGFFQTFDGLQVVSLSALRGMADVRLPAALAVLAYWVVALPCAYLLAFRFDLGAVGIWVGLAAGLATAAATLIGRFIRLTVRRGGPAPNASRR